MRVNHTYDAARPGLHSRLATQVMSQDWIVGNGSSSWSAPEKAIKVGR